MSPGRIPPLSRRLGRGDGGATGRVRWRAAGAAHACPADAAGAGRRGRVSLRTVNDLERGVATTPQKETVRLLADALHLIGPERAQFETAARGRPLAACRAAAAAAMRSLPRDVASFTGRQRELRAVGEVRGDRGRGGEHSRDRRDGRGRQDRVRRPRRAPAGGPVPRRAGLPSAARAHARPGAGRPGRRAGQPAAGDRGSPGADPAGPGGAGGAVAGPGGGEAAAAGARRRGGQRAGAAAAAGRGRQPGAGDQPPAPVGA